MKKFLFYTMYVILIIIATLLCILDYGYAFSRFIIATLIMAIAQIVYIYSKINL